MRDDAIGFFWEDLQTKAGRVQYDRPIPAIPDTGWTATPPDKWPRLKGEKILGLDIETKDIELADNGPGWRKPEGDPAKAEVVGISVSTLKGGRWYFPFGHTIAPEQNLDKTAVLQWARDNLCEPGQAKVGANLMYDVDGLWTEGVPVTGPFIDVQHAECLIDENRKRYNLESLNRKYLDRGKTDEAVKDWIERAYGDSENYRSHLWHAPPCLVGPYAESDAGDPLEIWEKQWQILVDQQLDTLFGIETDLIEPLVQMRQHGVRVDIKAAEQLDVDLTAAMLVMDERLKAIAGRSINVGSSADLAVLFDKEGVYYPRTPKGAPSFRKEFLEHLDHPVGAIIRERRKLQKYRDTFVRGYILGKHINGRIYCLFHSLKGDENGTVSGRFSSSLPNLQNIPKRDKVWGPRMRALFLPEDGEEWVRHDWSQIEYRFLAHYGRGPNARVIRERYNKDPKTDFHNMTGDIIREHGGMVLDREPVKNINFGLVYGMGEETLIRNLGVNEVQGIKIVSTYHDAVPFVRQTYKAAQNMAASRGYIKTVLGRRRRFDMWGPRWGYATGDGPQALPYEAAGATWGYRYIQRQNTNKALNALLQGSAADLMKKAMAEMHKAGVQKYLGVMLLTCHDETGQSSDGSKAAREAMRETKHIMENCIKLTVPILAEQSTGKSWGACK